MILVKKLIFAPLFLISFIGLFYFASPLLQSVELIFSLDMQTLYKLIILSALIVSSATLFVIFASLALDWKLILSVTILCALVPILFIPLSLNLIVSPLTAASLLLTNLGVEGKMKSYLTFHAPTLLSPSIKQLTGFLILILAITYYLSINKVLSEKGFQIPDSLIDSALKFVPSSNLPVQGFKYSKNLVAQLPKITPEQTELPKKNPELLKQYDIDPKMLDTLPVSPAKPGSTTELVKPMIKEQLQSMLKPYQGFIPAVLALLFFLTLQSFTAILGIFLSPVIWLIFYILEKTKFIHFESEMREVKKLVV